MLLQTQWFPKIEVSLKAEIENDLKSLMVLLSEAPGF